jgi:hypothetical protein
MMTPAESRPTVEVPSETRPYSRGGPAFRWLYARWRQVLAFVDLLGEDGRPSSTKLMACAVCSTVLGTAVARTVVAPVEQVWTWPMFWILLMAFAVMFGRRYFGEFLGVLKEKWNGGLGA